MEMKLELELRGYLKKIWDAALVNNCLGGFLNSLYRWRPLCQHVLGQSDVCAPQKSGKKTHCGLCPGAIAVPAFVMFRGHRIVLCPGAISVPAFVICRGQSTRNCHSF